MHRRETGSSCLSRWKIPVIAAEGRHDRRASRGPEERRGIVNRVMKALGPISAAAPAFPLATSAIAALRIKAEGLGSGDFSPLWAGQDLSGCKEVSATVLTRELAGALANAPASLRREESLR
jgi:hypothetical protein